MKPLSIWLPLILIALVLLLSAANEGPKPSLSGRIQSEQNTHTDKGEARTRRPRSVAIAQAETAEVAVQYEHQPIKILILKDSSDYGLLYITALVAVIAFFQYRIANLAYAVDRPYVIVGETTLLNMTTPERMTEGLALTTVKIQVENVGKRPALITEIRGELLLLPNVSSGIPMPPSDWGILKTLRLAAAQKKVISEKASIEVLTQYERGLLAEEDYRAVKVTYEKIMVLAGTIKYRPLAGWWHKYKTSFGLRYNPPGFLGEKDFFSVGPVKYNRNT